MLISSHALQWFIQALSHEMVHLIIKQKHNWAMLDDKRSNKEWNEIHFLFLRAGSEIYPHLTLHTKVYFFLGWFVHQSVLTFLYNVYTILKTLKTVLHRLLCHGIAKHSILAVGQTPAGHQSTVGNPHSALVEKLSSLYFEYRHTTCHEHC